MGMKSSACPKDPLVHELSMASELVAECERRAGDRPIELIRVRVATTVSEPALRQAFDMLTGRGPLEGARLETEPFAVTLECGCGFSGSLGHDDIVGHKNVCPKCGEVSESERTGELELLEMKGK